MKTYPDFHVARLMLPAMMLTAILHLGFIAAGHRVERFDSEQKISICHTPPGNPANCHEIIVSINALQAHLDHGDALVCHHEEELQFYRDLAEPGQNPVIEAFH